MLLAVVTATAVVAILFWRRDHRRANELSRLRDEVCQRMEMELSSVVNWVTADRSKAAKLELHVLIPGHHLNHGLMQLCFGKPIVVDASAADSCWTMTDRGDECYLEVAQRLLDAYRARRR
jgi:hypothetical protein